MTTSTSTRTYNALMQDIMGVNSAHTHSDAMRTLATIGFHAEAAGDTFLVSVYETVATRCRISEKQAACFVRFALKNNIEC